METSTVPDNELNQQPNDGIEKQPKNDSSNDWGYRLKWPNRDVMVSLWIENVLATLNMLTSGLR